MLYLAPELQGRHHWLAMAAAFIPYGVFAWAAALLLVLVTARGRSRWWAVPLAVGLIGHGLVVLPYLPGTEPAHARTKPALTVLALNLRFGLADLDQLETVVEQTRPDVLVLTEVTRSGTTRFKQPGWRKRLPHQAGSSGRDFDQSEGTGDACGTMVLSKVPLTEVGRTESTPFTNLAVRLELPSGPVVLVAAHPVNPARAVKPWLRDGHALAGLAAGHAREPLIVAGDLNATAEHLTLRNLQARTGLVNAADGRGWHPTYPANRWHPPLIPIDHVLVSEHFATISYATVQINGTDHLGVLVELAVS